MLFARYAGWRHKQSRLLLSVPDQCYLCVTLRKYYAALCQRMANSISSPLPPVQKLSAHCKGLTSSNAFSQKLGAFWSSNVGGGRCRRSKDCSSYTPAMLAEVRIEEGCSTGLWRTICWPGSRQSSRRYSQILEGSTTEPRPKLQKQYPGHFGAFIASRGKL